MTPLIKTIQEAERQRFELQFGHDIPDEVDDQIDQLRVFLNQSIQRTVEEMVGEVRVWRDEISDDWYQKNHWANELLRRLSNHTPNEGEEA